MKTRYAFFVVSILAVVLLASCATQGDSTATEIESTRQVMPVIDPITIRIGHVTTDNPQHQTQYGMLAFADRVRELSGGLMQVRIYPDAALGSSVDMAHMLLEGTLHMADLENATMTNFTQETMWIDLPYIIQSYEHAEAVFDARSSVSRWIRPIFAEDGFRILGLYHTGFRHMMNNVRPINHPSDMDDLTMRVMPSEVMVETLRAFGSYALAAPFADVPNLIRSGNINGHEQPLTNVVQFADVQPYLSMTGHFYNPRKFVFSEVLWQQLTPAQQLVIVEATEYAIGRMNAHHHRNSAILMQEIIAAGMRVNEISPANMAAFVEAGATVWPLFLESIGSGNAARGSVIIDMILSYIP